MSHKNHWSLEIPCPYKNCGAGEGAQCLQHHVDGAPSIRDNPHVIRLRHAREQGYEPEGYDEVRQAETLDEKVELMNEYGLEV